MPTYSTRANFDPFPGLLRFPAPSRFLKIVAFCRTFRRFCRTALLYNQSMKTYLSHFSALAHLPVQLAKEYFAKEIAAAPAVEVTVFEEKHRYRRKGRKVHLCSLKVPSKYKHCYNGQAVVSPELLFLQLSERLTIHQLILLGTLLCAKNDGPLSRPRTTQRKLQACVRSLLGHPGRPKALRAVKYVKDNCCSIMEAQLGLFLSLPHLLGGYAFKGWVYNSPVELNAECRKALGKKYLYPDICFPKQKIILEYQGAEHDTQIGIDEDSARTLALESMGYTVIAVTKSHLNDLNRFKLLVVHLAKLLKRRIRIRTHKFAKALVGLRALLPRIKFHVLRSYHSPFGTLSLLDYSEYRTLLVFLSSFRVPVPAHSP
jgi:hypothetical protein